MLEITSNKLPGGKCYRGYFLENQPSGIEQATLCRRFDGVEQIYKFLRSRAEIKNGVGRGLRGDDIQRLCMVVTMMLDTSNRWNLPEPVAACWMAVRLGSRGVSLPCRTPPNRPTRSARMMFIAASTFAVEFHQELTRSRAEFPLRFDPCSDLALAVFSGVTGVIGMELLSVIRRWALRDQLSIREISVEHHRKKVRFFGTVDLVNALEQEKAQGRSGQIADRLMRCDLVILDELGYLPFSPSGGALLFHLLSKLYEKAFVAITTNMSFSEWAACLAMPR